MPRPDTKLALMRTAERLFAERGVDRVSIAEINLAAAQKNRSAVQYHFRDKHGLLEAIIERHSVGVQKAWLEQLSRLDADSTSDIRSVLEVLVRPMVDRLDDPDNGREYALIAAQLVGHPQFPLFHAPARSFEGASEMARRLLPLVDLHPGLVQMRMYRVMEVLFHSVANYARNRESGGLPAMVREVFMSDLVDTLYALVTAKPSAKTKRLLEAGERGDPL